MKWHQKAQALNSLLPLLFLVFHSLIHLLLVVVITAKWWHIQIDRLLSYSPDSCCNGGDNLVMSYKIQVCSVIFRCSNFGLQCADMFDLEMDQICLMFSSKNIQQTGRRKREREPQNTSVHYYILKLVIWLKKRSQWTVF